tara:strand:+ start:595 stop:1221 length:627 start_codon:yes stop_codon:yes gene_type:complete
MDSQMNMQSGGSQFSIESLMTPNFVFFVTTIAVIGYLYYTRNVLGRDSDIKSESTVMFDKQMYLELGFMIILGFCIFIFGRNDNSTFVWIYVLVPIVYLMVKSLLIFNKVTDYMDRSPDNVSFGSDIADIINAQKSGQVPVTKQSNDTMNITNQLNAALGVHEGMKQPLNNQQFNNSHDLSARNNNVFGGGNIPNGNSAMGNQGFSLF